ncbi:endoplasmic reticulum metallopeptidase 1-like [Photinus pyralis]|uniref:endoplasmic reticulum metallopeptidase 1-like n=1 Tax=Photinus pyralis TaxID=7054 RepID=UPI001267146E|nr:endoplasmic reticulum metallopeptidase 1-like [Photinus pyralis]
MIISYNLEMEEEYANEEPSKDLQRHRQSGEIPTIAGIIFIIFVSGLCGVVYLIDDIRPTPLHIEDEILNPERFIAERAQISLKKLVDIGERITGTDANDVQAVKTLTLEIAEIIANANENKKIEFDQQVVSGQVSDHLRIFENVQNLVVKVHGQSKYSILVNVHFDTAPTSPGGSDDGINCAVALEILRKLANSPTQYVHNIVFLFNGAEEIGLLGSNGFVAHHRWAHEIRVFVNLEANGVGGKILLFQVGSKQPWLLNYFGAVTLPHAQVIAEELYTFLPFGTDYTIFNSMDEYSGYDFAFVRNQQRYHTRFDDLNIPLGSYQHTGDLLLKLVKNLANASEILDISQTQEETEHVYYDFLGLFLIYYTKTIGVFINSITVILSVLIALKAFYDFRKKCKTFFAYALVTFLGLMLGWALAAAFAVTVSFILRAQDYNMIWYGNPWMICGLYVIPISAMSCVPVALFKQFVAKDLTYNMHTQLQLHMLRLIWTVVLLVGTCMGIRSTYIVLVPVVFQTGAFLLIHLTCSQYTVRVWQILYFIFTIPATMFIIYLMLLLTPTVTASAVNPYLHPELFIALLYLLLTLFAGSIYVPFVTLLRRWYITIGSALGIFVIFFVLIFTPIAFPYSATDNAASPQRFVCYYSNQVFRNEMTHSVIAREKQLHCSGDYNAEKTLYKYVREPKFDEDSDLIPLDKTVQLQLDSRIYLNPSTVQYNFTIEGPSTMSLVIETMNNAIIRSAKIYMSNESVILQSNVTDYYIDYIRGKESLPLRFVLKVHLVDHNAKALQFRLRGSYHYSSSNISIPYYDKYLKSFPIWTNVDAKLVINDAWSF